MIDDYIEDLKKSLQGLGDNPAPVLDGPIEFAQNSFGERAEFICVSEGTMDISEFHNSLKCYDMETSFEIGIYVEREMHDMRAKHLTRARGILKDVWEALGDLLVCGFQLIRVGAARDLTFASTSVAYRIQCTLNTTEDERSCQ